MGACFGYKIKLQLTNLSMLTGLLINAHNMKNKKNCENPKYFGKLRISYKAFKQIRAGELDSRTQLIFMFLSCLW